LLRYDPPAPPPVEVTELKIELLPFVPVRLLIAPPAPPPPTVTAYVVSASDILLSALEPPPDGCPITEDLYPPAPPPAPDAKLVGVVEFPPPPPPAMTRYVTVIPLIDENSPNPRDESEPRVEMTGID
jgi:hypothetical protein